MSDDGWTGAARLEGGSALLDLGVPVVVPEYRAGGSAPYPAQIEDLRSALRWVKASGSHYGIQGGNVIVAGAGTGGHLAALVGTTDGETFTTAEARIAGVLVLSAPVDLERLMNPYFPPSETLKSKAMELLGCTPEACQTPAADANPSREASPGDPPFLILHGADDTISPEHSALLHEALERSGVPSTLRILPVGDDDGAAWYTDVADLIENFLDEVLPSNPIRKRPARR